MNQEAIRNIEVLRDIVAAYPETNFNLSTWSDYREECGTLYCTAGLAACQPYFNMKGLSLCAAGGLQLHGESIWSDDNMEKLDGIFGDDSFHKLFDTRGDGQYDSQFPGAVGVIYDEDYGSEEVEFPTGTTDKALAVWRLDYVLAKLKEQA